MPVRPICTVPPALTAAVLSTVPCGPADAPAGGQRRSRLAWRQRVGAGRVEPVLHGLDDGVDDPDVRD